MAKKDLTEIAKYIAFELCNPDVADNFLVEVDHAAEEMKEFPLAGALYKSKKDRKQQYRMKLIKNYIAYYGAATTHTLTIKKVISSLRRKY
jgi:uncharacterized protein (DUF302 family)